MAWSGSLNCDKELFRKAEQEGLFINDSRPVQQPSDPFRGVQATNLDVSVTMLVSLASKHEEDWPMVGLLSIIIEVDHEFNGV